MTFPEITRQLADAIGMNMPSDLTERETAAGVMLVATRIIQLQRDSIALSASSKIVVDLSPVSHQYN